MTMRSSSTACAWTQPVTEVGSSVTIITAADIEAQGFDFVLDAVATAPGVTINQNGTFGGCCVCAYSRRVQRTNAGHHRRCGGQRSNVARRRLRLRPPRSEPTSNASKFYAARNRPCGAQTRLAASSTSLPTDPAEGRALESVCTRPGHSAHCAAGIDFTGAGERLDYRFAVTTNRHSDGISKADEANGNTESRCIMIRRPISARLGSRVGAEVVG